MSKLKWIRLSLMFTSFTSVYCQNALPRVNIITPSPVQIGSEMKVKCAASTVGGVQVFTGLHNARLVRRVSLKVSDTETWAVYNPSSPVTTLIKQYQAVSQYEKIEENNFEMGGGEIGNGDERFHNNVDTIYLTFTAKAKRSLMREFICCFDYYRSTAPYEGVVNFTQKPAVPFYRIHVCDEVIGCDVDMKRYLPQSSTVRLGQNQLVLFQFCMQGLVDGYVTINGDKSMGKCAITITEVYKHGTKTTMTLTYNMTDIKQHGTHNVSLIPVRNAQALKDPTSDHCDLDPDQN